MARPLLLVHAHPDDEVLTTGGVMAAQLAADEPVCLVTCTLGEQGEVIPESLQHLAEDPDALGRHRIGELESALSELAAGQGTVDQRFLGGAGRYRDSGMMGTAPNEDPRSFWQADLREAADHLVRIIREVRPEVLLTYDHFGGYGHPDHIKAHRVAMYAADLAGVRGYAHELGAAWEIPRIYWAVMGAEPLAAGVAALGPHASTQWFDPARPPGVPAADIDVTVDISAFLDRKRAAMTAHHTQVRVEQDRFSLSNDFDFPFLTTEHFQLVRGDPGADDTLFPDLSDG